MTNKVSLSVCYGNHHRVGRPFGRAMVDGLDVVAVGIEHESGVVAGMVLGTKAGGAVVLAAGCQSSLVEAVNHRTVPGLECEMAAAGQRLARADDEFIPEAEPANLVPGYFEHLEL